MKRIKILFPNECDCGSVSGGFDLLDNERLYNGSIITVDCEWCYKQYQVRLVFADMNRLED